MNRYALAVVCALLFPVSNANATFRACLSEINLHSESTSEGSTGHVVGLNITNCPHACGTYKRVYIDIADKELYAHALAISVKGTAVTVGFEDNATSKGGAVHGSYTCKLKSIWE